MSARAQIAAAVLASMIARSAEAGDGVGRHLRVVLDISGSMKHKDAPRLATLSTLLLYDLARPRAGEDSFAVIPFESRRPWTPRSPPPEWKGTELPARNRSELAAALRSIPYDGCCTYFFSPLKRAVLELTREASGPAIVRTVVIITDGLPEKSVRAEDARAIESELAKVIREESIRLYVLAFGDEASKERSFFDEIVRATGADPRERVLVDRDGHEILENMIDIFSRSFGYSKVGPYDLEHPWETELSGGDNARVAVVLSNLRPKPPEVVIDVPPGRPLNYDGGVLTGNEIGASYALRWILGPEDKQRYTIQRHPGARAAVLRPTSLDLEVLPAPPHKSATKTMAGVDYPLLVQVHPSHGAKSDPGADVLVKYSQNGRLIRDANGSPRFTKDAVFRPPAGAPHGTATSDGRVYSIVTNFENPAENEEVYKGYVELEARRGGDMVRVGHRTLEHAHAVEVYPYVEILLARESDVAHRVGISADASRALGRRERGCAEVELQLSPGSRLPHPQRPIYSLRAVLKERELIGPLAGAGFTLDGDPLQVDNRPGDVAGAWYNGRALPLKTLLGKHELCVQLGRPTDGDPAKAVELPVLFKLQEDPYDEFEVIKPFTFKVYVKKPGVELWASWILGVGLLCALAASLWYLRDRPTLPDDLVVAVGPDQDGAELAVQELGEASLGAKLAGLAVERPIIPGPGHGVLGWICAADRDLYRLRVRDRRGVVIHNVEAQETLRAENGFVLVRVHRIYRCFIEDEGAIRFRLEYRC